MKRYILHFLLNNGDFHGFSHVVILVFMDVCFLFEMHVFMRIFPSGRISVALV